MYESQIQRTQIEIDNRLSLAASRKGPRIKQLQGQVSLINKIFLDAQDNMARLHKAELQQRYYEQSVMKLQGNDYQKQIDKITSHLKDLRE